MAAAERPSRSDAAGPDEANLEDSLYRSRKLALQKPRLILKVSLTPPRTLRLRTLTTSPGRALSFLPGSEGVPFRCKSGVPIQCCLTNTAAYARWLAREIDARSTSIRLSATNSLFVGMVVDAYGGEEVIAAANHLHIATSASTASVIAHPNARILLRHGVRVVSGHPAREAIGGTKAGE